MAVASAGPYARRGLMKQEWDIKATWTGKTPEEKEGDWYPP